MIILIGAKWILTLPVLGSCQAHTRTVACLCLLHLCPGNSHLVIGYQHVRAVHHGILGAFLQRNLISSICQAVRQVQLRAGRHAHDVVQGSNRHIIAVIGSNQILLSIGQLYLGSQHIRFCHGTNGKLGIYIFQMLRKGIHGILCHLDLVLCLQCLVVCCHGTGLHLLLGQLQPQLGSIHPKISRLDCPFQLTAGIYREG